MSQIKVNTNDLKKEAMVLKESANEVLSLQNRLSDISSGVNSAYNGQLEQAYKTITYGSLSSAISSQTRLSDLEMELLSRANKFEAANETNSQGLASISGNFADFIENSPVLQALIGLGKIDIKKAVLLWGLGGCIGLIIDLIIFLPDLKNLLEKGNKPTDPAPENNTLKTTDTPPKERLFKLGTLSQKYESNGDPGRVSSGSGDIGGVSYGAYQMTSSGGGTVSRFIKSPAAAPWSSEFVGLVPGSKEFTTKWQSIAKREPEKFLDAQHEYIKQTHYDPMVAKTKNLGLDVNSRSCALQDVIWSTSVQHGGGTNVVEKALEGKDPALLSDEEIIKAIYAERGRKNPDGTLARFSGSSAAVQKGVANRFDRELKDALEMLKKEQAQ